MRIPCLETSKDTPIDPPNNCETIFDCQRSQDGLLFNNGSLSNIPCNGDVPFSLPWVGCDGNRAPDFAAGGEGLKVSVGQIRFDSSDGITNNYIYTAPNAAGPHSVRATWGNRNDPFLCSKTIEFSCIPSNNEFPQKTGKGVVEIIGFGTGGDFGEGDGSKVYFIENANDSGPGSARLALEASGKRLIVPKASFDIPVPRPINVSKNDMTFKGSAAPGSGINFQATPENKTFTLRTTAKNLFFENIGVFQNNDSTGDPSNRDSVNISEFSENVVFSQFAAAYGTDETVSIFHSGSDVSNITLQYGIIFDSLNDAGHPKGDHSKAGLIGNNLRRICIHHCVFSGNEKRNMRFDGDLMQFINNITIKACGDEFRGVTVGRRSSASRARIDIKGNRLYGRGSNNRPGLVYPKNIFGQGPVSIYADSNLDDEFVTSPNQNQENYFGGYGGSQPPYAVFANAPQVPGTSEICTHEGAEVENLYDYLLDCVGPHSWNRSKLYSDALRIQENIGRCVNRAKQIY